MRPRVSVVIPAYNEGEEINDCLDRILEAVKLPCEVLVVYDTPDDTTAPHVREYARRDHRVRPLLNTEGRGPASALRFGIRHVTADVTVVTMADGSDDPMQIDQLTRLVERGVVVAAASRYMRGGQQVGGPRLKGLISRVAGLSLHLIARVGTHDPTNSFKAYSTEFIREVGIASDAGFELGIEMTAKARRRGLPIAEIPTIWLDRNTGQSNFKVREWIPRYLRWYLAALGPHRVPMRPAYRVPPHAWETDRDDKTEVT
jgi:dolichol-phosphate mannosyltransferase